MDTSQLVTKSDLEDYYRRTETMVLAVVSKVVGEVVGEIVGDALRLIDARFDKLEARMDRFEDKLDRTAAIVELHTVEIRSLQRRII